MKSIKHLAIILSVFGLMACSLSPQKETHSLIEMEPLYSVMFLDGGTACSIRNEEGADLQGDVIILDEKTNYPEALQIKEALKLSPCGPGGSFVCFMESDEGLVNPWALTGLTETNLGTLEPAFVCRADILDESQDALVLKKRNEGFFIPSFGFVLPSPQ